MMATKAIVTVITPTSMGMLAEPAPLLGVSFRESLSDAKKKTISLSGRQGTVQADLRTTVLTH
jgi:hypothetical protein